MKKKLLKENEQFSLCSFFFLKNHGKMKTNLNVKKIVDSLKIQIKPLIWKFCQICSILTLCTSKIIKTKCFAVQHLIDHYTEQFNQCWHLSDEHMMRCIIRFHWAQPTKHHKLRKIKYLENEYNEGCAHANLCNMAIQHKYHHYFH